MYRNHNPGQPTYYMGLNMPWPNAGPTVLYSPANVGYSHLTRGELFAHRWLDGHYGDHAGYDYDVVTDLDLHRDPNLLKDYRAVVMNGHSEYWSGEAMDAVDRYLAGSGKTDGADRQYHALAGLVQPGGNRNGMPQAESRTRDREDAPIARSANFTTARTSAVVVSLNSPGTPPATWWV